MNDKLEKEIEEIAKEQKKTMKRRDKNNQLYKFTFMFQ